ncbi:septation protein SepH [Bifidobacterium sp. ESL0764]|uniref:septation protein SepH n=1 Tax=Bifidobacterium sp. ESL0764 TaxID=2983228 RepID=UPI0023F6BF70|nr:septation protein SepH [Bifidobacterium sp. ESL0764]WEV66341.1 septation protein SepH [Bifidobacterium sp. ESL0764]
MSISSVTDARFDHVDEDGELVFVSKGLKFRIPVDDTLEHAILEARQILSEAEEINSPGLAQTLPISSIQALIRAGAQPEKVAEKYGLSQALVRRFSAAVETEKQYAIEQFLAVSAPKGSKVHSVEDLIARTLAAARIGMESVKWGATRRGREPWLITATFSTQRNRIRAEWTWNMHDNTVECQNTAAQILLGETDTTRQSDQVNDRTPDANAQSDGSGQLQGNTDRTAAASEKTALNHEDRETAASAFRTSPVVLPGDSVRSARIASTVAAMQEQNDDGIEAPGSDTAKDSAYGDRNQTDSSTTGSVSLPYPVPTTNQPQASPINVQTPASATTTASADSLSLPLPDRTPAAKPQTLTPFGDEPAAQAGNDNSDISGNTDDQADRQSTDNGQNHDAHKHGKRKSGRSAVPSWDEILFGE